MEWTKIKPKHFLFTDFKLNEHGALARLLCLTAYLERIPSTQEMVKATHYKTLIALQQRLNSHSIALQDVLNKVLEDSAKVEHKKVISRGTSKRYRDKQKAGDVSLDTTEKIREDKRREDNTIVYTSLVTAWNERLAPKVAQLTTERRKHLSARVGEPTFVNNYQLLLQKIQDSDFLMGRIPRDEKHKSWKPTFDWLIKNDRNYVKLLEGAYDNKKRRGDV